MSSPFKGTSRRNPMSRIITPRVLTLSIFIILLTGCGGGSPVSNDITANLSPREVLDSFADACIAGDVDSACDLMLYPDRWRATMEKAHDALPIFGHSLRDAEERTRGRNVYRFRYRLRHPDDPQHREMINVIYVRRVRDLRGNLSRWGIDFIDPGEGRGHGSHRASQAADRSGQFGTMYTHASILSKAIIDYYVEMYPEDEEFTGELGYFNSDNHWYDVLVSHPGPIDTILFFDYDNYENMPPDAVLVKNTATALLQAGSADEDVFVGEYNGDGSVNYTRRIDVERDEDGFHFISYNNFGDDDDTFFKGFAHFLTPATQDIWETDFVEFNDLDVIGGVGDAAVSAVDWSLGYGVLGPYDIFGLFDLRMSRNRKTFPEAVNLYDYSQAALYGMPPAERLANSFYTMGFVIHLLEDQGTPAHARNDGHGVPIISSIPGLGGLSPDPIEEWAESLNSSFIAETQNLYDQLVAEDNRIERDEDGFPDDPLLQNLYDNAVHQNYAGVEALMKYTSLRTNHMCFSEDTIYTSTNSSAAVTNTWPQLTDLNLDFFGKTVVYGNPGWPFNQEDNNYLAARGNAMFDVWRSWFWLNNWFSDPDVDDVEEALYDGWDILTVADDDDDDYYSNNTLGVREQQWRLLFPHVVRTGAAVMHEFYLECHE